MSGGGERSAAAAGRPEGAAAYVPLVARRPPLPARQHGCAQEHRKLTHKQLAHRRASYCLETLWSLQPRAARAMSACATLAERASCTQESKRGARPSAQEAATTMPKMANKDPSDKPCRDNLTGLKPRLPIFSE